jgi:hypothetical protein
MYTIDDISVYILNWKKVSQNSLKLVNNIKPYLTDITVINCDESLTLEDSIKKIQLDDTHYYGSQFQHSILDIKENKLYCGIVGDNIPENNFEKIFSNALDMFNKYNTGIYAPNDKRSHHVNRNNLLEANIYHVDNTDCGFWFINPDIIKRIKIINFGMLSPLGWGIDIVIIKEAIRLGFIVIRDYDVETDQLDHTTNYNERYAFIGLHQLLKEYEKFCMHPR